MNQVIQFQHVSKRFYLNQHSQTVQEVLFGRFRKVKAGEMEQEFWPLQDISFEIAAGETVGIIGPNGVGKSTILKLIARILEPTSGTITTHGRVRTLLELGAGFHPDLTGRENIYLNGAILGLGRDEIKRKFEQIVEFSELEQFIDMPVKHYSSGMYVRLGFSVAIHTEPEILLVDEVLSVGDAAFQLKCMEQIDHLRESGVTILFVSHSVDAVRSICSRAMWLSEGKLVANGSVEAVVSRYLDHTWAQEEERQQANSDEQEQEDRRWGSGKVEITNVQLLDAQGVERQQFQVGDTLIMQIHYRTTERIERPVFGMAIHRNDGVHVTGPNTKFAGHDIPWIEGSGSVQYVIKSLPLLEGLYHISVAVHNWADTEMYDYHDRLYTFRVLPSEGERYGIITLRGEWKIPMPVL